MIETGFAAYLPEPGDASEAMVGLLGPKLRAARERQEAEDEAAVPASTVDFLRRLGVAVPALRGQVVRPLVDFLESEYGVDDDVDNVIDVSFIEMLPEPGEGGSEIEQLLGPKLRAELDRQRNWSEPPPEG